MGDGIIKGIIVAAIVGLFGWVMSINATVHVNTAEIKHNKQALMDNTQASRDLTKAISDLRVYIAKTVKE